MANATEWWEDFFDEAYVETWADEAAFDQTAEDVPLLIGLLDLPAGARIIDIPCGFGRFAGPLHDAGFDVTGVDLSEVQIRLAEERNPGPAYLVGDMREPPAGPFDAVLNLYSSFGYFEDPADDRACLDAWYRVLAPGGQLVIETMHRDRLAWLHGQQIEDSALERVDTDWMGGTNTSTVNVGGEQRTFTFRLYTATDYLNMLTEAGFADIEMFGGLDGSPLDPTKRLAIRARRG
ncbi:MAG TPA: class I SAM-dependent methyltransferase [Nitriliruptorales bacterium]|jgi:SAM-dependent methyltransferase